MPVVEVDFHFQKQNLSYIFIFKNENIITLK